MSFKYLANLVKFRVANNKFVSAFNNDGYVIKKDVSIFGDEDINLALKLSLSAFNCVPPFTYFQEDDTENLEQLADPVVTYAVYILLTRQALIEKGREMSIKDNGVEYIPPHLGDFLRDISEELVNRWTDYVKDLKQCGRFYNDFVKED